MKNQSQSGTGNINQAVRGKKNRVSQTIYLTDPGVPPQPRVVRKARRTPLTLGRLRFLGFIGAVVDLWAFTQIIRNVMAPLDEQPSTGAGNVLIGALLVGCTLVVVWMCGAVFLKHGTLTMFKYRSKRLPVVYGDGSRRLSVAWLGGDCSGCVAEGGSKIGTVVPYNRLMGTTPRAGKDGTMYNAEDRHYVLGCSRSFDHYEKVSDTDTSWLP